MKIEEGKFYKTRKGFKAEIYRIHTDNPKYSIHGCVYDQNVGVNSVSWGSSGMFLFGGEDHDYDLVSEWQEPIDFDWECLPKWSDMYIAMDKNRDWFCFKNKPNKESGGWYCGSIYDFELIPKEYEPKNFNKDWKDSLFENPKYKEESDHLKKEGWHMFEETAEEERPQDVEWERFNADRWNENIQVKTIDGRKVRILCVDGDVKYGSDTAFPVVGIVSGCLHCWLEDGFFKHSDDSCNDLIMQKLPKKSSYKSRMRVEELKSDETVICSINNTNNK